MRQKLQSIGQCLRDPNGFLGPVLTLLSGTVIAHAITGSALIALARLYSPADFGVLGLFSSIVYILAVAVGLRFDVATVLPQDDNEALDLMCLALLGTVIFSMLSALVILLLPLDKVGGSNSAGVLPYLWLLPINLLAVGFYSALQNWSIRDRAFARVARSRVVQSASAAGAQIGVGALAPTPLGLISGLIINSCAGAVVLLRPFLRSASQISRPTARRLRSTFIKYADFPRYSVWEALANSASIQLPILLIGALTNAGEVGQLVLAMSVVQAPMALFGNATAQVFMAQAPTRMRKGQLEDFTFQTLKGLSRTGCPVLLLLGVAAPFAFPLLFGVEWTRAGILVSWMTPWLLLQFLASPVSTVLNIRGRLRLAFVFQTAGLLFRLGAVWVGATYAAGAASEAYGVSGAVFYGIYLYLVVRLARSAH